MGPMKPMPIGARYFCGDCESKKANEPIAFGHKFGPTKAEYQEQVTAHYTENHKDLHYPLNQDKADAKERAKKLAKTKAKSPERKLLEAILEAVGGPKGGMDLSGSYNPVTRPRELPDFTEFDFPDANVADDAVEEIELDQLISIQARMGRRLLGVEIQGLDAEFGAEFLTVPDNADLEILTDIALNTRTGVHNLDDPENLWSTFFRSIVANVEATAGTGTAVIADYEAHNDVPPGGVVYVAPRLFWRFINAMDRQVDTGDLFVRIATVDQRLSTFLLFELLEQFSGLFGLT